MRIGMQKIFVSSTSRDLVPYREAVKNVILRLDMYPIVMEAFNPTDKNALQLCYDKVQEADALIGIYAYRYGYAPGTGVMYQTASGETRDGDGILGITHLEYLWALEKGIPVILYVISDTDANGQAMAWPPTHMEDEPGKTRLKQFKHLVMGRHVVGFFYSPDHLALQVSTALNEVIRSAPVASAAPSHSAAPFMVDDLPADFVPRPTEFEPLVQALLGTDSTVGITTALKGAGGFGKTTLARAVCHDSRVRQKFTDGVLWATLGEKPGEADLIQQMRDMMTRLMGQTPPELGLQALKTLWSETLGDKACLIVIDDAWRASDLDPFLQGGSKSVRLITTRSATILPAKTMARPVDAMTTNEAVQLLRTGLSDGEEKALTELAARLGEWPLLLKLANRSLLNRINNNETLSVALAWVSKALGRKGFDALRDPDSAHQRHAAVSATLEVSLSLLSGDQRHQYERLAIFPEDVDVPLKTLETLWNLDDFDTEDLCQRLLNLSLLLAYDLAGRTIRLHDVVRTYLRDLLRVNLVEWNRALLQAYEIGEWHTLPADELYLWRWLAYHLIEAEQVEVLHGLLLDHRYLQAKLDATDANTLIADTNQKGLEDDESISLIASTLSMSAHILTQDKRTLAHQLVGRLMGHRRVLETIRAFTDRIMEAVSSLYPAFPDADQLVLELAGGALLRTFIGHTDNVNSAAFSPDGHYIVSASSDTTVRLWNVQTGQCLYTLTGHRDTVNSAAFSTEGRYIVSASDDKTMRLWETHTGQRLLILTGHKRAVNSAVFSTDNTRIVSASEDGTICVWDTHTGQKRLTLTGHLRTRLKIKP